MIISIDGGFSCVACSQSFNFACNAKTHVEAKHLNTGGFACDLCGFVSKTRDSLRKHTKNKHKFWNLTINILNIINIFVQFILNFSMKYYTSFLLGRYAELDEVINSMVGFQDGEYFCLVCNRKFKCLVKNVQAHIEAKHMSSKGVSCDICGFVSKTRDSLRKHMKKHDALTN